MPFACKQTAPRAQYGRRTQRSRVCAWSLWRATEIKEPRGQVGWPGTTGPAAAPAARRLFLASSARDMRGRRPYPSFGSLATFTLSFGQEAPRRACFPGRYSRKAEIRCGGSLTAVPPLGPLRSEGRTSRCLSGAGPAQTLVEWSICGCSGVSDRVCFASLVIPAQGFRRRPCAVRRREAQGG